MTAICEGKPESAVTLTNNRGESAKKKSLFRFRNKNSRGLKMRVQIEKDYIARLSASRNGDNPEAEFGSPEDALAAEVAGFLSEPW